MVIHRFDNGDVLQSYEGAIAACFNGPRSVLSTAPLGGGQRDDLKWIFNHGGETSGVMKAPTYAEHVALISKELGLEPEFCSGMSTAALAENVSIKTLDFKDIKVTAVVTAGIDINAGRAGDTALWHESDGGFSYVAGTVNIMLFINAALNEGALVRSLVTCTEAKTAAIQELLVPSRYSRGLATGSGTDGTIIVANPESPVKLSEAGKHFKLGELIARTVMEAVKEALYLQTGLNPQRQKNVFARLGRYGITKEAVIKKALEKGVSKDGLAENIEEISINKDFVVISSLYAHLLDQLSWGMLDSYEAQRAAGELLRMMGASVSQDSSLDSFDAMICAYIDSIVSVL